MLVTCHYCNTFCYQNFIHPKEHDFGTHSFKDWYSHTYTYKYNDST